jgi:outer membrane receptor for monomeric catechols
VTRSLELFVVDYSLDLFSNFTFFATDPVHGDGIEQVDHRRYAGGRFTQRWVVPGEGAVWETLAGGNLRFDDADVSLYHQERRDRLDTVNDARVRQGSVGVFVQEQATFGRLRAVAGLRYDAFRFDVASHLPAGSGTVESGVTDEVILQPKASLIADLREGEELFLNYGVGFHSNDARATVLNDGGVPALPRAVGYEIGWRWRASSGRVDLGASLWRLDLQNELVYVGDEGGTEVRGPSRREGIEIEMRGRIAPWLWGDLDAAFSRANLSETGDPVPLAPRRLISAGLTLRTPGGWSGSLRARHLGDRPAIEDESFTAEGYTVVDARAAWEHGPLEYWLNIENLTNSDFREAQFFNESRLPSEPAPVGDIHFTPGNSRNYRFGVAYRF